jgi:hypothetical protein
VCLTLNSNQLELIESNVFYYVPKLNNLNLTDNRLKKIELSHLTKLVDLQLAYNEFELIVKVNSLDLRFLSLKFNKIKRIESNSFKGLLKLKKINLLNNSIIEIDSNAFNNSNFKELVLTIPNMSVKMMHLLIDQLKPKLDHGGKYVEVYESIFIENRIDNGYDYCMKMLFLIKFKIYYNFINENSDVNNVETDECLNLTRVRDTFNRFNDTFHHIQYIPEVKPPIDLLTHQIYTWLVFAIITLVILYLYIEFEKYIKNNKINVIKSKEENEIVNEVIVSPDNSNHIELPLQEAVEYIEDLNEIVNLDELIQRRNRKKDKKPESKLINEVINNSNIVEIHLKEAIDNKDEVPKNESVKEISQEEIIYDQKIL